MAKKVLTSQWLSDHNAVALDRIRFSVFDTETTGLDAERDALLQIAGCRIVNAALVPEDQFEANIDPGRKIPARATKFHGIRDADVQDAASPVVVLRDFHSWCGDSVLVAHNAAFDLSFLGRHELQSGVHFDQPVLDSLLFSASLSLPAQSQELDAIAARHGIAIRNRHSALGDAIATAGILLALIAQARKAGIFTLGQALKQCRRARRYRRLQAQRWPAR